MNDPDVDPSRHHLLARLGLIEAAIDAEVARRQSASTGGIGDIFLTDVEVSAALASGGGEPIRPAGAAAVRRAELEALASQAEAAGDVIRFRSLSRSLGLTPLDEELLLAALAPEVDRRFGDLYAHLHEDRRRREPSAGLAMLLAGVSSASTETQGRLAPTAPLLAAGLVMLAGPDVSLLERSLHVPRRVVEFVLGGDLPDAALAPILVDPFPVASSTTDQLLAAMRSGGRVAYVQDDQGVGGASAAAAAFEAQGRPTLLLDLDLIAPESDLASLAAAANREAHLTGAGLVVGPVEVLADRGSDAVRAFARLAAPIVLFGRSSWDPTWSRDAVLHVRATHLDEAVQIEVWSKALGADAADVVGVSADAMAYRLTPQQILRATQAARQLAASHGRPVAREDVLRGVRAQNASGLQRLARRIEPRVTWDDIIVPARVEAQLRELPMRWRNRDRVIEDWGLGRGVASGRGVSALFAGKSGTGKTLAAEVIAGDLGLDLYVVDLSTVVDKYIGETSKNLERIFDQADRVNGVLLFDEADALFGKRSAVSDSKDRHANVEVAFLLQRMETFDGVAILTTNLAANLDEAFLRRLDSIVDFGAPNVDQRRAMWTAGLKRGVPCDPDVDIDGLAQQFDLSGAEIANVIVSAAYHAADRDGMIGMVDLVGAIVREHRKLGRHLTDSDLGEYRRFASLR